MKKIIALSIIHFFIVSLSAQTNDAEGSKIKADIEKLNKEMERVFNANDMAAYDKNFEALVREYADIFIRYDQMIS